MERIIIFTLLCITFIAVYANSPKIISERDFTEEVKKNISSTEFITYSIDGYRYAKIAEPDTTRYFIISTDYSQVKGFNGTTTLGIVLNADLSVNNVRIIKSQDTHAYIRRLTSMGFLQRLQGFQKDDSVDAITGATITCRAIVQTLNECIDKFANIIETINSTP